MTKELMRIKADSGVISPSTKKQETKPNNNNLLRRRKKI